MEIIDNNNMTRSIPIIVIAIGVVFSYLLYLIVQKEAVIVQKEAMIVQLDAEKDSLLNDPQFNKRQAMLAFKEAEEWRQAKVAEMYANVTDDELLDATRWMNAAEPFAEHRSCQFTVDQWSESIDLRDMWNKMQMMTSPYFFWNDTCHKTMLALHSHHTTGIEGNTLTLTETMRVINNEPLLAGVSEDGRFLSPITSNSLLEVKSMHLILEALKFSSPPVSADGVSLITKTMLVDINSAILGNLSSIRTHAVAVGHQRIVLPMPDEVPHLLDVYLEWVNGRLQSLLSKIDSLATKDILRGSLSLACDAHTKLVHIHPFSDGNGRLARIVSGLILRVSLLPAPLFLKEGRHTYIKAVGQNTIHGDSSDLCALHAQAVMRTLDTMIALSKKSCTV